LTEDFLSSGVRRRRGAWCDVGASDNSRCYRMRTRAGGRDSVPPASARDDAAPLAAGGLCLASGDGTPGGTRCRAQSKPARRAATRGEASPDVTPLHCAAELEASAAPASTSTWSSSASSRGPRLQPRLATPVGRALAPTSIQVVSQASKRDERSEVARRRRRGPRYKSERAHKRAAGGLLAAQVVAFGLDSPQALSRRWLRRAGQETPRARSSLSVDRARGMMSSGSRKSHTHKNARGAGRATNQVQRMRDGAELRMSEYRRVPGCSSNPSGLA